MTTPAPTSFDGAVCGQTDPEAFYPPIGGSNQAAKKVCAKCPIGPNGANGNTCLTWALDHNERFGVWGGMAEHERRELRAGVRLSQLDIDAVAVQRAMNGDRVHLNRAERLTAVRKLTAQGWGAEQIAARLRIAERTVTRDRAAS